MEKLSIEEKAKAYDELLIKLQKAKVDNNVCDERYCCVIDDIIPELKESKDERIRKALIKGFNECLISSSHYPENAVKYWHGIVIDDILAWLEKQGEQKSADKIKQKSWSEVDNFMYNKIKNLLTDISLAPEAINSLFDWLKDLKDRYTWKPSEEMLEALDIAIRAGIQLGSWEEKALRELQKQLKAL